MRASSAAFAIPPVIAPSFLRSASTSNRTPVAVIVPPLAAHFARLAQ
jgi:hypothetical protein